jgi:outer membrane protein assembly factor BamD (BamD/ComL family)
MMAKKIVVTLAALAVLAGGLALAQEKSKDKELYDKAKAAVYQKDYQAAVASLKEIVNAYAKSSYYAESLYWLGYSIDKLAPAFSDIERTIEAEKEALENVNLLLEKFPSNAWATDAKVLRVKIAEALIKNGLRDYRKYINSGVAGGVSGGVEGGVEGGVLGGIEGGRSRGGEKPRDAELELKLVALDALMNMDEDKAFPILEKLVKEGKDPELREKALFVLSQHENPKVIPLLTELAMKDPSEDIREKAIFWLGQREDQDSLAALIKIYETADPKMKERLVMAFGQSDNPKARAKLVEIARTDKDVSAREKAIFWIGQSSEKDTPAILLDIYKSSSDAKIKKQIIFALAQGEEKSVATLIEMARKETDLELKKQLIFWLGQSNSPEAAKFLKEIIDK